VASAGSTNTAKGRTGSFTIIAMRLFTSVRRSSELNRTLCVVLVVRGSVDETETCDAGGQLQSEASLRVIQESTGKPGTLQVVRKTAIGRVKLAETFDYLWDGQEYKLTPHRELVAKQRGRCAPMLTPPRIDALGLGARSWLRRRRESRD
jgi:hypothetical protein